MNLYLFKSEYELLINIYKYLNAEGARPDLASALISTINRLNSKIEKQEAKPRKRKSAQWVHPVHPELVKEVDPDKTLMRLLLESGYPVQEMHHHESDLYIFVTPETATIVEGWCKTHGYSRTHHCPTFIDQVTGEQMYDCAFQYDAEEAVQWIRSKN